jgi:hypothetical protein
VIDGLNSSQDPGDPLAVRCDQPVREGSDRSGFKRGVDQLRCAIALDIQLGGAVTSERDGGVGPPNIDVQDPGYSASQVLPASTRGLPSVSMG